MKLTRIDLNSWLLQIADLTILIDPWLIDPLVFYGQPWLFSAYHNTPPIFTPATLPKVDLILLSQGLDDHCHKPTLAQLDRNIPVVASSSAAAVVKKLGYSSVTSLIPQQKHTIAEKLEITAIAGAVVQPGEVENAYVLKDQQGKKNVYYQPHLFQPNSGIKEIVTNLDLAIAPVIGQVLPLLGQVIMGPQQAMDLVKTLRPRFFVPNALGDIRSEGLLPKLIQSVGSVDEFRDQLTASGITTELLTPAPGETVELIGVC